MKRIAVLAAIGCVLGWYAVGRAQQPIQGALVNPGMVTGQDYLKMPAASQQAYAAGVVDGMLTSSMFGAPEVRLQTLVGCVSGMNNNQIAAMLSVHLKAKPEIWHLGANMALFQALYDRCPKPAAK